MMMIVITRCSQNYIIELVHIKEFGVDSIDHILSFDRSNP